SLIPELLALTKACSGSDIVSAHTYSANNGAPVNVCKLNGAVYYTAKMAIDCDGRTTPNCPGTGANMDCCYQNDTSFHNLQDQPLAAEYDPYVVIPQDFSTPGLDQNNGGNVIAVLYKGQLEYAVFGDQGPTDLIGEASFRTAANLGINSSPASGGVDGDVTYIVFTSSNARPHDIESQPEIQSLGAQLAQQLVQSN
ncbi:MAG TPA: glycoside hydrolase family 75 protein, partial [Polyangiaceae bacterium]